MKPMPAPISSTLSPGRTICGIWLASSVSKRPSRIARWITGVMIAGSGGTTTPLSFEVRALARTVYWIDQPWVVFAGQPRLLSSVNIL